MTFKEGQFVVSKACGMTLFGVIEACWPEFVSITRHWKTPKDASRSPKYAAEYEPFDRVEDAPHWHRKPEECELYDFANGPLYDANGQRFTTQPTEAPNDRR